VRLCVLLLPLALQELPLKLPWGLNPFAGGDCLVEALLSGEGAVETLV